MKKLLLLAVFACCCSLAKAQDIITFKNGDEIEAKLLEIGKHDVRFRLFNEPDGVVYTVRKSELLMVKHESGRNEVFSSDSNTYGGAYGDLSRYVPHVEGISPGMKYKELKQLYNRAAYVSLPGDPYSPAWSGVASFVIPGLGQMICGEVGRGFAFFGGHIALSVATTLSSAACYNYGNYAMGTVIGIVGLSGVIAIDICSIVDAVRVAKVKNMYTQDLRNNYSFDIKLHPSVDVMQVGNTLQPTINMTLALNF